MRKKYLVETSAVLPAIDFSLPDHNEHFRTETAGADLFGSVYVRMEVLRRWVCELIEFAELMEQCSTVADCFTHWSQLYGRRPKLAGDLVAWMLRQNGVVRNDNPHEVATEVAQKAIDLLRAFDLVTSARINNTAKCQIGGMNFAVDFNHLLPELSALRKEFLSGIEDCPVRAFLQLGNARGRAAKLAEQLKGKTTKKEKNIAAPLREALALERVNCRECKKIGDQIIALEQPQSVTLVHVDSSYDTLCTCTGRPHLKLRAVATFRPPKE
jgi:hypothetical protein